MIDPGTATLIAQLGSSLMDGLFGGGEQGPRDSYSVSQLMLKPESASETSMAQLQQALFKLASRNSMEAMPQNMTLQSLSQNQGAPR